MNLLKKIMFSFFTLYSYNLIAVNFGIIIPINIFTVLIILLLDIPGLIFLVVTYFSFF